MTASGRFVLRIPPETHQRLQNQARLSGISLNQLCNQLIDRSMGSIDQSEHAPILREIQKLWKESLLGVVLVGSQVRGDHTRTSDIDLLIVFSSGTTIARHLYSEWDTKISKKTSSYSPQFVSLPKNPSDSGGLWFEVALEGEVLWEKNSITSDFLRSLRAIISSGKAQRRMSHGHPYWEKLEVVDHEK